MGTYVFTFFIIFNSFWRASDIEDGWKGIRVFKSTRADVESILGKPVEEKNNRFRYETDEMIVSVLYSATPCSDTSRLTGEFNVPRDTVIGYDLVPMKKMLLSDLKLSEGKYVRNEDSHVIGFVEYYLREYALRISTNLSGREKAEYIRHIYFERTTKDVTKYGCQPVANGFGD